MTNGWTPERRRLQGLMIHRWRPWEKSTGPRTAAGKAIVSQNGYKGGPARETLRALGRAIKRLEARRDDLIRRRE